MVGALFPRNQEQGTRCELIFAQIDGYLFTIYPVRSKEQNMAYRALFTGFNLTLKAVLEGRSASFKVGVRPG